uniref:Uncharacterized protein n=2 Tax=Chlamydia pneumoniae TaxID=83558 RepID=A0A0F7X1L5_CHLPN|nr:Uncharacterized protein BN1224_H12_BS_00030 [Chlamydia pneumoniae]
MLAKAIPKIKLTIPRPRATCAASPGIGMEIRIIPRQSRSIPRANKLMITAIDLHCARLAIGSASVKLGCGVVVCEFIAFLVISKNFIVKEF